MTDLAAKPRSFFSPWRIAGWGTLALLLSTPAILRFPWTGSDFVIMGLLLGSVGLGIEFLVRLSGNAMIRLGAVIVVLTSFLTIWVNLAVGMIGDDNPYNLLFLVPVALGIGGVIAVRLDGRKSALVALVAGLAQAGFGLGGYGQDPRGAVLSACFGLFWWLAAALFRGGASR
jgi:hypothetical protein